MIDERASIHHSARIDPSARIGPFAFVGPGVRVGPDTTLAPSVTILDDCEIGARVNIGAGTVIGCPGFGYRFEDGRHIPAPHTGRVIIEDDVDIGANCTIARARRDATRIGAGTKIDCLVHIGHNVVVGRNCIIIAQTGVSGSVSIGQGVILAGQVGIKDHVRIGDNSIIYAKSALYRSIPPGSRYSGIPARPHRDNLRALARQHRGRD
jgi:UDP-3-O-[3-hydroxymyristoyl] glucosamine N-acyltransferase